MTKSIAFTCLGNWDSTYCLRAKCFGEFLQKQKWDVHYLIPDIEKHREIRESNIHLIPTSPLSFILQTRKVLKKLGCDFVHFLNPEVKALGVTLFNSRHQIIGDWEDWHAKSRDRGIRRLITLTADFLMRKKSHHVLVASKWLQSQFRDTCRQEPQYIPYANLPTEMPQAANPYNQKTYVWMGAFRDHLDFDLVLETILVLKNRGQFPQFEMIGHGPSWHKARDFKEKHSLDNLSLPGFLDWDDMLNRLCWAHILLFPIRDNISNRARCPFKVFQYASAKRPIVTNRVGELVSFLEEKAHYVECTPDSFADTILKYDTADRPADVEYQLDSHTWEERGNRLLEAIC